MMNAIAALSAEQGYEATKIADIVRRAGVARKTLYDNFDGKEDLFLAAFDDFLVTIRDAVQVACEQVEGVWQTRVEGGLEAFLRVVAENPEAARMAMIESLSATPSAAARYDAALREFVTMLHAATPSGSSLPATIEETLVGGVAWVVNQQIRRGEAAAAPALLPELSEFVLSPYHGVAEISSQPGGESDSTVPDSNT
jgi:AcrR family transcriptional regulator